MQPSRHQRLRLRRILLASIASLLHLLLCWLAYASGHMRLDLLGKLLEHGAGRSPASRARDDHRGEGSQTHRLQDLLGHDDFVRAISAWLRGQRYANRVSNSFL